MTFEKNYKIYLVVNGHNAHYEIKKRKFWFLWFTVVHKESGVGGEFSFINKFTTIDDVECWISRDQKLTNRSSGKELISWC